jgi:mycothiol synthase
VKNTKASATTTEPALPPGYAMRPAQMDEVGRVTELIAACERALGGPQTLFEDDIRIQWTAPRFDLSIDTWILTAGHAIVGYGEFQDTRSDAGLEAFGVVHPDHHGRGLGSFLLRRIEARAREHATASARRLELNNIVVGGDERARHLMETSGYERARIFWHMVIDLTDSIPDVDLPDAIEVRPFDVERDNHSVHALMEEAFSHHYGYSPTPFDEWWRESSSRSDFDPTLWVLAWHGSELVAGVIGGSRGDDAWIHDVGVLSPWRRRRLAWSLLSRSLAEFRKRGYRHAGLNVDALNETGATELYRRIGFQVRTAFDAYRKQVLPRPRAGDTTTPRAAG